MFWDSSAIIPLCIEEPQARVIRDILKKDNAIAVWWGSLIECYSVFARLRRGRLLKPAEEDQVREEFALLSNAWTEIEPSEDIRNNAARLLLLHPLHAADSLQLSAALIWANKSPKGHHFVCLDQGLREAARKEGFKLLPTSF